jgi:hypothetical protein
MKIAYFLCFLVVIAMPHARAQDTRKVDDPPELVSRRADYLSAVNRAQIPLLTNYLRALEPIKQQFTREAKADAALAVDREIASVKEQLAAAQAGTEITAASLVQFQIDSVFWGDGSKRMRDVTAQVKTIYESGTPTVVLGGATLGGGDPVPYATKVVVIKYTINGKKKEKTFKDTYTLNFKQDLR